ncbi:lytic polysaccharide monooxygenase [Haloechinothrix sp. LS1_15]|uniref:lytic polysaccharide monooxygenase auxiliary activity family 9 protein n=1 Tax=Haloechinothrix sp. LS1_15 TaxID=2652248 RepID=UPI002945C17A|nr:lytic polysaccharide monooxygenase [Haloechinothrix sp. LS1_15]MDV6013937.1 chitin-binding protein [Haloechinothrix sp. LS1_15]
MLAGTATAATLALLGAPAASGHGYTDDPISRQLHCAEGNVEDCGAIQWEPQSVEGPDGFPEGGPADGKICAGGNEHFAPLDNPRGGNWPTQELEAGADHEFRWSFTAAHSTEKFEYFVTNDSYDPLEPLTRDMLEPDPFETVPFEGRPPFEHSHTSRLPGNKEGRHLILAVWTVADTDNAFYACHDVVFTGNGNGTDPGDPELPECDAAAWDAEATYQSGDTVSHGGAEYRARWWTRGTEPGSGGSWSVWDFLGNCR